MKPLFNDEQTPLEAEAAFSLLTQERKLKKLYPKKRQTAYAEFAALLVQLQAKGGTSAVERFIGLCAASATHGNAEITYEHMLARLMEDTFISINCPDVHKLFPPELRATLLIAENAHVRNPAPPPHSDVLDEIAEVRARHLRRQAKLKLRKAERLIALRNYQRTNNAL